MKFALLSLISAMSSAAQAAMPGFCGQLDLREMKNEDLQNVILLQDPRIAREQCGLFPGETLLICSSCESGDAQALMATLRPVVGEQSHLDWHSSWHKIRGLSSVDPETLAKLQRAGYVPTGWTVEQFNQHLAGGKLNGEDFLYMHRLMLKMTQLELAAAGKPCIAAWKDLPQPKNGGKPESLKIYQAQLDGLRNPEFLKSVKTLNRLGAIIEPLLHQNLHGYYRDPKGCSKAATDLGYCDDLVPPETSPLNRQFWKIHGLVDTLIGGWLSVHGYREISVDCEGRPACYQWQGTWVGAYPKAKVAG